MCYNCGCGMPDEDHGNPKNITNKTFKEAGDSNKMSEDESKTHTKELLETLEAAKAT